HRVALIGRRPRQEVQDARQPTAVVRVHAVYPLLADLVEPGRHVGRVQEYRRTDVRNPDMPARLPRVVVQQARQALRLAVRQDERVVLGPDLARWRSHPPSNAVAGDLALPMLELQQVQAARGEDEEVDLVDRTLRADE